MRRVKSLSSDSASVSGSEPVYGMPSISSSAGTRASRLRETPVPSLKLKTNSGGAFRSASIIGRPLPSSVTVCPSARSASAMARMVAGESNSSWRSSGAPAGSGPAGLRSKAMPMCIGGSSMWGSSERCDQLTEGTPTVCGLPPGYGCKMISIDPPTPTRNHFGFLVEPYRVHYTGQVFSDCLMRSRASGESAVLGPVSVSSTADR